MRKFVLILAASALLANCDNAVEKPENLISESKMVDIIYDLSLLESIKTQKPMALTKHNIDSKNYIYKKYGIDSAQFASSNRYYSSDLERYKKIYEKVDKRIDSEKAAVDALIKTSGVKPDAMDPDAPRVE